MTAISICLVVVLLLAGEALCFAYHESFMRAIRARDSAIAKEDYGTAILGGLGMILTIVSSLVLSEKLASALNLKNWLADIAFAAATAGAGIMLVKLTGMEKVFRKHEGEHRV